MKRHSDSIILITAIVGVPVGILGVILAYLSFSASYDIAKRSGAFDKGDARLFYGTSEVELGVPTRLLFLLDFKAAPVSFCNLNLGVGNAGARTLKGISLTLRVPFQLAIPTELLQSSVSAMNPLKQETTTRSVTKAGNFAYIVYTLPNIDPEKGIRITDTLPCHETKFKDQIDIEPKGPTITYTFEYSYDVQVSISAEDQRVKDYSLTLTGIQRQSSDAPLVSYVFEYEKKLASQRRKDYSFLKYLTGLTSNASETLILVAPQTKIIGQEGQTMQIFADTSEMILMKTPLFRLRYLFGRGS